MAGLRAEEAAYYLDDNAPCIRFSRTDQLVDLDGFEDSSRRFDPLLEALQPTTAT